MSKMPKLTAVSLKNFLIVVVLLLITLVGGGFYMTTAWLTERSNDIYSNIASMNQNRLNLTEAETLRKELETLSTEREKAAAFAVLADHHQSQVIQDINQYATLAKISVRDIQFPATPTEERIKNVSITFNNPVKYENLLSFIYLVEHNLPKMSINNLQIKADDRQISVTELHLGVLTQ
jgi:hypothetical protein